MYNVYFFKKTKNFIKSSKNIKKIKVKIFKFKKIPKFFD